MGRQKDRHLEAPGEANRDKHINFLATEQGDPDPSSEKSNNDSEANSAAIVDNGFFSDEGTSTQISDEDRPGSVSGKNNENGTPLKPDKNKTVRDEINAKSDNDDMLADDR